MTTAMHIKSSITPWEDTAFVRTFEAARDEVHTLENVEPHHAGVLVQQKLRESGYPNAVVEVVRTPAEALEHTAHWLVRRDG